MKKWFAILLCTLGLLAVACYNPPPEPTCPLAADPLATETVAPAAWHDATPDVYSACETKTFEASRQVVDVPGHYEACRSGYSEIPGHKCQRNSYPWDKYTRAWVPDTYKTETFGPIAVVYGEKSSDPNHCHRPAGSSLGVPSWAMSDFNKLPEKMDRTLVTPAHDGYWDDPVCKVPNAPPDMCEVEGLELLLASDPLCVEPAPDMCEVKGLEELLADDVLCVEPVIPPTPEPPEVCKPINYTWFRCNSGAWTYTPGGSADKCWCGGLTGEKAAKESYDCGKTWTWYNNGVKVPPMGLGFYAAPACNIGGWCAK